MIRTLFMKDIYRKWQPIRFLFFLSHFTFLQLSPKTVEHIHQMSLMKTMNWKYNIVIGTFKKATLNVLL